MDAQLEKIQGQIGTAVLDAGNGKVVKSTGDLSNDASPCAAIYKMLKDTAKCLSGEPLKRINITYSEFSYLVTLDEYNVYIAKNTRAASAYTASSEASLQPCFRSVSFIFKLRLGVWARFLRGARLSVFRTR
ncbi:hypothetical protein B484DRAFT_425539, partial [Ochromonadaceae sp. CCMP2298]